jgi:hypothetical protein
VGQGSRRLEAGARPVRSGVRDKARSIANGKLAVGVSEVFVWPLRDEIAQLRLFVKEVAQRLAERP